MKMNNENKRPKQCDRILRYLDEFGSITQFEALKDLGVLRLASRIHEIKKSGIKISSMMVHDYNRWKEPIHYARYFYTPTETEKNNQISIADLEKQSM